MNIILLGAPGSGKGTQSQVLCEKLGYAHIATGDILRANISGKTPLGIKAKEYVDKGELVPDELVIDLIKDRISQDDCRNGCLFDGFPRNYGQAVALDAKVKIGAVILLDIDHDLLCERITGRRTCTVCNEIYHISNHNLPECQCGGLLFQRPDDTVETFEKRMGVYEKSTAPLIKFYEEKKLLVRVDASQSIDKVTQDILGLVK